MSTTVLLTCIVIACLQAYAVTSVIYLIEGTQFDFVCPAQNETYPFVFSIDLNGTNEHYVTCTNADSCIYFNNDTTLTFNITGIYLNLKVRDIQQFRTIELVTCSHNNFNFSSQALIIAKPVNPVCEPPKLINDNKTISLKCTTEKVYPKAACVFFDTHLNSFPDGIISYSHEEISIDSNIYYKTRCNWTSELSNFEAGNYSFDAFIFPEVTNDTTHGIKVTSDSVSLSKLNSVIVISKKYVIKLNQILCHLILCLFFTSIQVKPSVALSSKCFNGPNIVDSYIKPNATANCLCILENVGTPPGRVAWLNDKGQDVGEFVTNTTTNLIITPMSDLEKYTCAGQSILKNGNSIFLYNVTYASGPEICIIKTDSYWDICNSRYITINMSCQVEKSNVIPGLKSVFYVNSTSVSGIIDSHLVGDTHMANTTVTTTTAGNASVKCTAVNSKFGDIATDCYHVTLIREPPKLEPSLTINKEIAQVSLVQENEFYSVICKAFGGVPPVSNVTVSCGNITESTQSGNIFTSSVTFTRNMTGQNCTCTAQHITGCYRNNTALLERLNVTYQSKVTYFKVQTTMIENGSLTELLCEAEGNPLPTITIMKGNTILQQNFNSQRIVLRKTMYCSDAGSYKCQAKNTQLSTALEVTHSQILSLNIQCPFQLLSIQNTHSNISYQVGASFSTTFDVIGFPEPSNFVLLKAEKNYMREINFTPTLAKYYTDSRKQITVNYTIGEPPHITVQIDISNLTTTDFTKYTLMVLQNGFQNLTYSFYIQQVAILTNEPGTNVGAIVGGCIAAIVIILLIVALVFIKKRYGNVICREKKTEREVTRSQNYSELEVPVQHEGRHNYEIPQLKSTGETKLHYTNVTPPSQQEEIHNHEAPQFKSTGETMMQDSDVRRVRVTEDSSSTHCTTTIVDPD